MLLNTAKCQGYSFYRFWVIKEKPTMEGDGRGGGELRASPARLGLNFKDPSNTSQTLMHENDCAGQTFSSIDLDTHATLKQPCLGIKTKNKISVL